MLNKPKYRLLKNTEYALNGFVDVVKHESSFRLQLLLFAVMSIVAWLLPIDAALCLMLNISLFIPILAELVNSAIERVVDLVTLEQVEMAGRAKDVGATVVFVSLICTGAIWIGTLSVIFLGVDT